MASPFDVAKNIIYDRGGVVEDVKGNEFILQLILASTSPERACIVDRYMYTVHTDLLCGLLYTALRDVKKMAGWTWEKKPKESKSKHAKLVTAYIEKTATPDYNSNPGQFTRDYFDLLLFLVEHDDAFIMKMLLRLDADDKEFKKFGLTNPLKEKEMKQSPLF
jgi:hypothetical protein